MVFLPLVAESCSKLIHSLRLEIFIERLPCVSTLGLSCSDRSYFSRARLHLALGTWLPAFHTGVFPAYLVQPQFSAGAGGERPEVGQPTKGREGLFGH